MNTILITGGADYIVRSTFVAPREAGFHSVILDDFCYSSPVVLAPLTQP